MKKIYFLALALVASVFSAKAIDGALPGRFTINADGDTVHFSFTNLNYDTLFKSWHFVANMELDAQSNTWYFKPNQYEYSNAYPTLHLSHFAFGTSGWKNSGANAYLPTDTSQVNADYWVGGSPENGLTGDYIFADWGIYNPIEYGGQMAGLWRVLSRDEWIYILTGRENADKLFTAARITHYDDWDQKTYNYDGLVLLPDNWVKPEGAKNVLLLSNYGFKPDNESWGALYRNDNLDLNTFALNTYTEEEWAVLEKAGAVFLPTAGYRKGGEIINVGGYYITSTPKNEDKIGVITFDGWTIEAPAYPRGRGYSVRLVTRPASDKQGIDEVGIQPSAVSGQKVLRNGMLLIERNGKTYNAQGMEVPEAR